MKTLAILAVLILSPAVMAGSENTNTTGDDIVMKGDGTGTFTGTHTATSTNDNTGYTEDCLGNANRLSENPDSDCDELVEGTDSGDEE